MAAVQIVAPRPASNPASETDWISRFFLFGAIFVRLEIGDDQPFDDGLRGRGTAFAFAREKNEFLHAARFQVAQRRSGNLAQIGRGKFFGLPCPDEEQALRVAGLRENGPGRVQATCR